jgi:hypothetical protein
VPSTSAQKPGSSPAVAPAVVPSTRLGTGRRWARASSSFDGVTSSSTDVRDCACSGSPAYEAVIACVPSPIAVGEYAEVQRALNAPAGSRLQLAGENVPRPSVVNETGPVGTLRAFAGPVSVTVATQSIAACTTTVFSPQFSDSREGLIAPAPEALPVIVAVSAMPAATAPRAIRLYVLLLELTERRWRRPLTNA